MSLAEITIILKARLIEVIAKQDKISALELKTTFMVLKESTYNTEKIEIARLFETLEDVARDAAQGVVLLSELPSDQTINLVLGNS